MTKRDHSTAEGQKRLMAESVGMDSEHWVGRPIARRSGDYGADPIGDGKFRMVPSGDIVDYAERCKRLRTPEEKKMAGE